jgi:hypothetical protein
MLAAKSLLGTWQADGMADLVEKDRELQRKLGEDAVKPRIWIALLLSRLPQNLAARLSMNTVNGKRVPWTRRRSWTSCARTEFTPRGGGSAVGGSSAQGGGGGVSHGGSKSGFGGGGKGGGGAGGGGKHGGGSSADAQVVKKPRHDKAHPAANLPEHKRFGKYDEALRRTKLLVNLPESERAEKPEKKGACHACGNGGHPWNDCPQLAKLYADKKVWVYRQEDIRR